MAASTTARLDAIESAIADLREAIASDSRRIAKLENAPRTTRKVAEPVRKVSKGKKSKKGWKVACKACGRKFLPHGCGVLNHTCNGVMIDLR